MNFDFYEEDVEEDLKYQIGDEIVNMGTIEDSTLIVAFDYLSLKASEFCFNNPAITASDYAKVFELKKEISSIPISEFIDDFSIKRRFHFHSIDLYKKMFLLNKFRELLDYDEFIEPYALPTLYQIAVYTDNVRQKAPRIVGFFGKKAVFHLLWLDYNHQIYRRR